MTHAGGERLLRWLGRSVFEAKVRFLPCSICGDDRLVCCLLLGLGASSFCSFSSRLFWDCRKEILRCCRSSSRRWGDCCCCCWGDCCCGGELPLLSLFLDHFLDEVNQVLNQSSESLFTPILRAILFSGTSSQPKEEASPSVAEVNSNTSVSSSAGGGDIFLSSGFGGDFEPFSDVFSYCLSEDAGGDSSD